MRESPRPLLAPDTPCRSRHRDARSGLTACAKYPAASAATREPRPVSIPASTSLRQRPRSGAARSARAACQPAASSGVGSRVVASCHLPVSSSKAPPRRSDRAPSHPRRTAASPLPSQTRDVTSSSARENHKRPDKTVLTPWAGRHDIPAAIQLSRSLAGHDLQEGLQAQERTVLTCRGYQVPSLPDADPVRLILIRRAPSL